MERGIGMTKKAIQKIDRILKVLEYKAKLDGTDIDANAIYIKVCTIVTDLDMKEPVSTEEKSFIDPALKNLYTTFGLDYERWLKILE